jgi:uncharacterized protein (TIGR00106 family)
MVLLDFSMAPVGKGESVAPYVARCLEVISASGLRYQLHSMGTILEGEWGQVFGVLQRCYEVLRPDCNRISCSIRVDYRQGSESRLESKVRRVEELVGRPLQK